MKEKIIKEHLELKGNRNDLKVLFEKFSKNYDNIEVNTDLMAGSPCIKATRIPVYGILRQIAETGTISGARDAWPRLTTKQVKEAIRFAADVIDGETE